MSCNLETAVGDVTIFLPGDLAATIDVEIRLRGGNRGWNSRDYDIFTDFDVPVKDSDASDDDRRWRDDGRISARGDINGGRPHQAFNNQR